MTEILNSKRVARMADSYEFSWALSASVGKLSEEKFALAENTRDRLMSEAGFDRASSDEIVAAVDLVELREVERARRFQKRRRDREERDQMMSAGL